MKKILILPFGILLALASCMKKKDIANPADYAVFLKDGILDQPKQQAGREINFWQQRLQKDTGSYVNMLQLASAYLQSFKLSGDIAALKKGDSLLKGSSARLKDSDPEILFAISQTAITQHQFHNAAFYNAAAEKAEGDRFINRLLDFDAGMETGNYKDAVLQLASLSDKSSFDYLIRKAKLEDHNGNLDGAIELMEQAFDKVKDKKRSLYCWTLSNLGDMYGHAGQIEKAYNSYLKVLQKDSSYLYALKGIAWIAYAHDNNTKEAKKIIQFLLSQTKMPDLWLTLAEMEEWEGNTAKSESYSRQFLQEVVQPGYGDMYNKYLIHLYTEQLKDYDKALALAKKEVSNRPTPETYDWLAWVYYNKGEKEKAYAIVSTHVYGQTFEPNAMLHTGFIFAANQQEGKAREILEECLDSFFELGPVTTKKIKEKLASL
ncbi:MAG: hypothetical protein J0L56_06070 [Chitinophagales bacterium]|nr:hypothetical protein [Chitinophagales bacterium]